VAGSYSTIFIAAPIVLRLQYGTAGQATGAALGRS
jgi:preprotein translocase subunit SecF